MPARWLRRLTTVAVVAVCAAHCAPEADVDTARRAATSDAAGSAGNHPALRRTAPMSLADRAAWRAALGWPDSCEQAFESTHAGEDGGLAINVVAPGVSLVEVLCAAGTYQPSHMYIRYDEQGASPLASLLEFPVVGSPEGATSGTSTETEIWGESSFAADTRELSVLALSRQLADCGVWSRYAMGTGPPRLTAAAAMLPCPATPGRPAESANGGAPAGWRPLSLSK